MPYDTSQWKPAKIEEKYEERQVKSQVGIPAQSYLIASTMALIFTQPIQSAPFEKESFSTSASGYDYLCRDYFDLKNNEISLCSELFQITKEESVTIISHSKWSLLGMGKDLAQAINDLKENAHIIASDYIDADDSELTEEAVKLKRFLIKYNA